VDYILYVWITISQPQQNGLDSSKELVVKAAFATMSECKAAQAGAEAAHAKQPDVFARFNCVRETDADREARQKKLAERNKALARRLCEMYPDQCK